MPAVFSNAISDEGTNYLRNMVANMDGVIPVARALKEKPATIARWTRVGLPKKRWAEVRRLCLATAKMSQNQPQNPNYNIMADFSVDPLRED